MDGAWGAAAATGEGDSDRRIRACDARRLVSPGTRGPHYDLIVLLLFRLVLGDASPHAWRPSPADGAAAIAGRRPPRAAARRPENDAVDQLTPRGATAKTAENGPADEALAYRAMVAAPVAS